MQGYYSATPTRHDQLQVYRTRQRSSIRSNNSSVSSLGVRPSLSAVPPSSPGPLNQSVNPIRPVSLRTAPSMHPKQQMPVALIPRSQASRQRSAEPANPAADTPLPRAPPLTLFLQSEIAAGPIPLRRRCALVPNCSANRHRALSLACSLNFASALAPAPASSPRRSTKPLPTLPALEAFS